jgi:hypothetical protein
VGRIVLPHTVDPRSGAPAALVVSGEAYRDVGRWQPLRLNRLPSQLMREIRALQGQLGPQTVIDSREAYLEQLAINVYTGPGALRLWVDDLEIVGAVAARSAASPLPSGGFAAPTGRLVSSGPRTSRPRIICQGSQLVVNDRPFFPRAVQHRGEPLAQLKNLGFNAVWLSQPPSAELLQESSASGLWLICPPPFAGALDGVPSFAPITPLWDAVLAWDLGEGYSASHFDEYCRIAKALRKADRGNQGFSRPLMCDVVTDCRAFSRHVDILRPSRRPLGSTLELADYVAWLRERPRLARPGTPFWTAVQTQVSPEYVEQVRCLTRGVMPRTSVSLEQLRLLTFAALSAGARGLLFETFTRLDTQTAEARQRSQMLELLNLELAIAEPWAAAGSLAATAPSNVPEVQGALFQTDKARLLLPLWLARGAQYATGQAAGNNVSFVVPGVPSNHEAYEITPCGAKRLDHQRATGGVRITLGEFSLATMVLFSDDRLVLKGISDRVARGSQRAAQLHYELAVARLLEIERLHEQLTFAHGTEPQAHTHLAAARGMLQEAEAALRAGKHDECYRLAQRGLRPALILERSYWEQELANASPVASPLSAHVGTLGEHRALLRRFRSGQLGANRLAAGDCEDVGRMKTAGWRMSMHRAPGVEASADVIIGNARSGNYSLRLQALSSDPNAPPDLVESPPIWVTTPNVKAAAGETLRIHGWVRVPAPITGSVDGLLIFDSLGGPALADRVDATPGWQEFTLFRVVGGSGPTTEVSVTFALSGLGEVWLDDVTIESVQMPRE